MGNRASTTNKGAVAPGPPSPSSSSKNDLDNMHTDAKPAGESPNQIKDGYDKPDSGQQESKQLEMPVVPGDESTNGDIVPNTNAKKNETVLEFNVTRDAHESSSPDTSCNGKHDESTSFNSKQSQQSVDSTENRSSAKQRGKRQGRSICKPKVHEGSSIIDRHANSDNYSRSSKSFIEGASLAMGGSMKMRRSTSMLGSGQESSTVMLGKMKSLSKKRVFSSSYRRGSATTFEQVEREKAAEDEYNNVLQLVANCQKRFTPYQKGTIRSMRKRGRAAISSESSRRLSSAGGLLAYRASQRSIRHLGSSNRFSSVEDDTEHTASSTPEEAALESALTKASIEACVLFASLNKRQIEDLCTCMSRMVVQKDEVIFQRGIVGDTFYVVVKGKVIVSVSKDENKEEQIVVAEIGPGGSFGELALLYNHPRTATITVKENDTVLSYLTRTEYRNVVLFEVSTMRKEMRLFLKGVPVFQGISGRQLTKLIDSFEGVSVERNKHVETTQSKGMFILVLSGHFVVDVSRGKEVVSGELGPGSWVVHLEDSDRDEAKWKAVEDGSKQFQSLLKASRVSIVKPSSETNTSATTPSSVAAPTTATVTTKTTATAGTAATTKTTATTSTSMESFVATEHSKLTQILATTDCQVLIAPAEDVLDCVGYSEGTSSHLQSLRAEILRSNPIFSELEQLQLETLAGLCEITKYKAEEYIFQAGQESKSIYVIVSGHVSIKRDGKTVINLYEGSILGESGAIQRAPRSADCVCDTDTTCFELKQEHIPDSLLPVLANLRYVSKLNETSTISFESLDIRHVIGVGSFGKVHLVLRDQDEEQVYALKAIDKMIIYEMDHFEHIQLERMVMAELDHPFLTKLYATFQDDRHLYLLLELVRGGELYNLLEAATRLTEIETKFYTASMLLAVNHLHERNIVYRDIKPENTILDKHGFLKLVDFGFARVVTDVTYTMCGTPDYIAPEVVLNSGHNQMVDMWGIGVFLYECLYGYTPFTNQNTAKSDMHVFKNITSAIVTFPARDPREMPLSSIEGYDRTSTSDDDGDEPISELAQAACVKLLQKQASARPSCASIINSTESVEWFDGFDWTALENLDMSAPYLPQIAARVVDHGKDNPDLDEYAIHQRQDDLDMQWSMECENVRKFDWDNW